MICESPAEEMIASDEEFNYKDKVIIELNEEEQEEQEENNEI